MVQGNVILIRVQVAAGDLAAAEFKLLIDKASHDLGLFRGYMSRLRTAESTMYHARLAHMQRRAEAAKAVVCKLIGLDQGASGSCQKVSRYQVAGLTDKARAVEVHESFNNFVDQVTSIHNIPKDRLTVCCVANWASMSTLKSELMKLQSDLIGCVLNQNTGAEHIGLLVMPVFCYTKGQVWRLESKALESFAGAGCNDDHSVMGSLSPRRTAVMSGPLSTACASCSPPAMARRFQSSATRAPCGRPQSCCPRAW